MIVAVTKSFEKDMLNVTDKKLATHLIAAIGRIESASTLSEIPNLKKIQARGNYYRLRIGPFRLGFRFDSPETVVLLRFMHRKDIYDNFP